MADALDQLRPPLPVPPPARAPDSPAGGLTLQAPAPDAAPALSAPAGLAAAALLVLALLLWRLRQEPRRRLRRDLQAFLQADQGIHPAVRARDLKVLAQRHALAPDAAWTTALDRLQFEPVAPADAARQLQALAAQLLRLERRP